MQGSGGWKGGCEFCHRFQGLVLEVSLALSVPSLCPGSASAPGLQALGDECQGGHQGPFFKLCPAVAETVETTDAPSALRTTPAAHGQLPMAEVLIAVNTEYGKRAPRILHFLMRIEAF